MRYEIQVCDLDETVRKSRTHWRKVKTAFTLHGAAQKFWRLTNNNTKRVVYRVFDRKTGRPVG